MKKLFLGLCLAVALFGLDACKEKEPAPVSPVVGRWEVNRGALSGFVAPYTGLNGGGLDLYYYDFGSFASRLDIRADNSFTNNVRSDGGVADANGTWNYTNNQLTLTYDDSDTEEYTYSSADGIEELTSPPQSVTLPFSGTAAAPVGQLRIVYRK